MDRKYLEKCKDLLLSHISFLLLNKRLIFLKNICMLENSCLT